MRVYASSVMGSENSAMSRGSGNITGFSYMSTDLAAKRLELLSKIVPARALIAILYNPDEPATTLAMQQTETAARAIGVTLQPLAARHPDELEPSFAAAVRERARALLVFTHGFAVLNRGRIIELAARHRLPTMYGWRDFVNEGGLVSYGPTSRPWSGRQQATSIESSRARNPVISPSSSPLGWGSLSTSRPPERSPLLQTDEVIE
jgi:ABC-type uncharacterized transport system substrate-binding protein